MKLENVAVVSKVGNKDSEKAAVDVAKKLLAKKATVYTISPVSVEGAKQMEELEEIQKDLAESSPEHLIEDVEQSIISEFDMEEEFETITDALETNPDIKRVQPETTPPVKEPKI